ncbi:Ferroporti-1 [Lentinula aff. detonsa]|uniref:Solute carrier family 40 member n=1 Tax=Lentinula aff. detonsa TaxID=2804958 RepID=A0AA38NBG5_9AGAR|nr:Ferroporti-1 [Lentinula aff. detonsa]
MSIYALTRAASAIIFSPVIGRYIDTANRIHVVRLSIGKPCSWLPHHPLVKRRLAAVGGCCGLASCSLVAVWRGTSVLGSGDPVIVAILACVEKLCSIMDLVSIEKDWIKKTYTNQGHSNHEGVLTTLNAQMQRIDLIYKLAGPFVIAIIESYSIKVAVLVNLGMNLASVAVEYYAIAKVYFIVTDYRPYPSTRCIQQEHDEIISGFPEKRLVGRAT